MANVDLRVLGTHDADVLGRVAEGVFDGPVLVDLADTFVARPAHILAVAVAEGVVVRMISSVRYLHPDKPPQPWINEVGVAGSHRRQGMDREMMLLTLDEARRRGCVEAGRAAWRESEEPRAFYRTLGGVEEGRDTQFAWAL